MNAEADTDVTVLLHCSTPAEASAAAQAIARAGDRPEARAVGQRARHLEARWWRPASFGPLVLNVPLQRAGPVDVGTALDDPGTVVVRWSHLAGDARTCRDFILQAFEVGGLLPAGSACGCARLPAGARRPMVAADAWAAVRRHGSTDLIDVARAAWSAVAPMLRPAATELGTTAGARPIGPATDCDAVAAFVMAPPRGPGQGSRFAEIARDVSALVKPRRRRPVRVGITVDLRRHEKLLAPVSTAGNLSLVGWINLDPAAPDATGASLAIQELLRSRFWCQQLAFDRWLAAFPGRSVERASDALISRLAGRAPVTITELWRDDLSICPACGRSQASTPSTISALVIPPALPPAGLVAGITRTAAQTVVVLRRITRPGSSASAWLAERAGRLPGQLSLSGPVSYG